jgi:hypothetical protein
MKSDAGSPSTARLFAAGTCLALAAAAGVAAAAGPPASDSPVFRGDPRHSGVSDSPAGPALTGLAWKFATKGPIRGAAALSGEAVVF